MFSCLGSKRNTRNCVVNPQSRTRTVDLSESRKKHEELKEELINLRKTRKKRAGKDRLREITQQNIKKLAVIRRLKTLQKNSLKKRRSLRKRLEKNKRSKSKSKRKSKRRRGNKITKVNTNESKEESTMGGRRRKRKSRRKRRY